MKITVIKLLSGLIVAGRGDQCNQVVSCVRQFGYSLDLSTQLSKSYLLKYGQINEQKRIGQEMYQVLLPYIQEIKEKVK